MTKKVAKKASETEEAVKEPAAIVKFDEPSKAKPKRKKKKKYLNNADLLAEVIKSQEQGKMNDKLAHMLQMLCDGFARKPSYVNYTYLDDMKAYAMLMLVKTWHKFNPEKSKNPFSFYTQCIYHSFIQFLHSERKQRDIRDVMLVENGMNPSFTFEDSSREMRDSDEA